MTNMSRPLSASKSGCPSIEFHSAAMLFKVFLFASTFPSALKQIELIAPAITDLSSARDIHRHFTAVLVRFAHYRMLGIAELLFDRAPEDNHQNHSDDTEKTGDRSGIRAAV